MLRVKNFLIQDFLVMLSMLSEIGKFRKDYGAGGGTRTHTELPLRDFESRASANFTTPASKRVNC